MESLLNNANATIDSALSAEDKASLKINLCNNFKYLLLKASEIDAPKVIPAITIVHAFDTACTCYSALSGNNIKGFNTEVITALMNATIISTIGHTNGILIESYVQVIADNILSPYISIVHNHLLLHGQNYNSVFISNVRNIFETDNIDEVYIRIQKVIKQATVLDSNVNNMRIAFGVIQ